MRLFVRVLGPRRAATAQNGGESPWRAASTRSFWSATLGGTRRCAAELGEPWSTCASPPLNLEGQGTGERKERTEWHSVVIFNENLARIAEQYLKKGSKVYVEGQLQTRKWTDQQGVEKYSTEVVLQRFRGELALLDGRGGGSAVEEDANGGGQSGAAAISVAPRPWSAARRRDEWRFPLQRNRRRHPVLSSAARHRDHVGCRHHRRRGARNPCR